MQAFKLQQTFKCFIIKDIQKHFLKINFELYQCDVRTYLKYQIIWSVRLFEVSSKSFGVNIFCAFAEYTFEKILTKLYGQRYIDV